MILESDFSAPDNAVNVLTNFLTKTAEDIKRTRVKNNTTNEK